MTNILYRVIQLSEIYVKMNVIFIAFLLLTIELSHQVKKYIVVQLTTLKFIFCNNLRKKSIAWWREANRRRFASGLERTKMFLETLRIFFRR